MNKVEKEISFIDIVEITIQHFAYQKPICKISKEFHLSQDFVGKTLSAGMKNKMVFEMVKSIIAGQEWETKSIVYTKEIFSKFK